MTREEIKKQTLEIDKLFTEFSISKSLILVFKDKANIILKKWGHIIKPKWERNLSKERRFEIYINNLFDNLILLKLLTDKMIQDEFGNEFIPSMKK